MKRIYEIIEGIIGILPQGDIPTTGIFQVDTEEKSGVANLPYAFGGEKPTKVKIVFSGEKRNRESFFGVWSQTPSQKLFFMKPDTYVLENFNKDATSPRLEHHWGHDFRDNIFHLKQLKAILEPPYGVTVSYPSPNMADQGPDIGSSIHRYGDDYPNKILDQLPLTVRHLNELLGQPIVRQRTIDEVIEEFLRITKLSEFLDALKSTGSG